MEKHDGENPLNWKWVFLTKCSSSSGPNHIWSKGHKLLTGMHIWEVLIACTNMTLRLHLWVPNPCASDKRAGIHTQSLTLPLHSINSYHCYSYSTSCIAEEQIQFHVNCSKIKKLRKWSPDSDAVIIPNPQPCNIHPYKMLKIPILGCVILYSQVLMFKLRQAPVWIHSFLLVATEKDRLNKIGR